jgi:type IV pilus assembly protein PilA
MKRYNSGKGFTLVEIMIVVVIIGLLAAMAIPAFAKVRQQSRTKAVLNNLRIISSAAQTYMMDKGMTQAGYTDLVGTTTDNLVNAVVPVLDENYSGLIYVTSQSQITLSSGAIGTVTYTF